MDKGIDVHPSLREIVSCVFDWIAADELVAGYISPLASSVRMRSSGTPFMKGELLEAGGMEMRIPIVIRYVKGEGWARPCGPPLKMGGRLLRVWLVTLRRLSALGDGHKFDLNAFVQGGGDAVEHGQGMALVIGVFEAADDEMLLSTNLANYRCVRASSGAVVDLSGDVVVS